MSKFTVDFGTWKGEVDETLFEHLPGDTRVALTLPPNMLVLNANGDVCAKKTATNVRHSIDSFGIEKSNIRWHTGADMKQWIDGKELKLLITFIHQHLSDD